MMVVGLERQTAVAEKKYRIKIWERIRGNTKEESNAFQNQTSDEKH